MKRGIGHPAATLAGDIPVPRGHRVDRLGALLAVVGIAAFVFLPLVVFKSNRLVPGDPRGWLEALPRWAALGSAATLALVAIVALRASSAALRLGAALLGLVIVALAVAAAANALTPPGNRIVRVAPGSGFWVLLVALGLLMTDAVTRLRPGPGLRVLFLALLIALVGFALSRGVFDNLSVMREYAVNADRFAREFRQHLWLALGSLAAAVVVGLPIGIVCHRSARLRAAMLGTLNVIETIPSLALFGILMAPLGALAAAVPLAAALGIQGIGTAPAIIALFLYALLPIVANTAAGLRRVSPAIVEAARGMGMTSWQVLVSVELVLALPVILTGIRIVLVQNIGLATIAALIGGGGLGTFVFQGIGQTAIDLVLLGAIPTVALAFTAAVVLDAIVEITERARR